MRQIIVDELRKYLVGDATMLDGEAQHFDLFGFGKPVEQTELLVDCFNRMQGYLIFRRMGLYEFLGIEPSGSLRAKLGHR